MWLVVALVVAAAVDDVAVAVDADVAAAVAALDENADADRLGALRAALSARAAAQAAQPKEAAPLGGVRPETLRALALEADAARAQIVAWPRARLANANVDVAGASALVFGGLEALLAFGIAALAVRRAPLVQRRARAWAAGLVPWPTWRRLLVPLLAVAARGAVEAVAVFAVVFTFDRALVAAPAEVRFFGPVAVAAVVARVVVLAVVGAASSAVLAGAAGLSAEARRGWLRFASGVAIAVVVGLAAHDAAVALVDHGVLSGLVSAAAVMLVAVVALWRLWRLDGVVARAWVARGGAGRLHRALLAPRPGVVAVAAGAAILIGDAVVDAVRDVAGQSGSARRLLAWAFRRRLQQLESAAATTTTTLPPAVQQALAAPLSLAERPALQQQRLARVRDRFAVLAGGGAGFSAALVGLPGSGRSSALAALLEARGDLPLSRGRPARHLTTAAESCAFLADMLGVKGAVDDDDLVAQLRALPPRLIVIDDAQRFLLRAPGALEGHKALIDVVGRTAFRHGWLLAFHEPTFFFASAVYGARNELQDVVTLGPWGADDTTALLAGRLKRAGLRPRFDDLVAGDDNVVDLVRTGESFFHLVWDSADGNPRAALTLLGQSLVVDDASAGVCRVRPFHSHETAELEGAEDVTRLVLAAVALHHTADAAELGRVLREPAHVCESALVFLRARGVVDVDDTGAARISAAWAVPARRFLAQKNLSFH